MAKEFNSSGLDRREEVVSPNYRAKVKSWPKSLKSIFDDPKELTKLTLFMMSITLAASVFPFFSEVIFLAFLYMVVVYGYFKNRYWRAPYRVPAYASEYLKKKTGYGFLDATEEGKKTGTGEYYLGAEFPDENGKLYEVWAEPNDLKTHRLVIGTTGSGKTEELLGLLHNTLMLDSGMIFIDGKADPKTYAQMLSMARTMGREEDLFTLNYLTSGRNVFGANDTKISNTYNPLAGGVPDQKTELMISLLSGGTNGKSDIWSDRAEAFLSAVIEPLSFLEYREYVQFSPKLLGNFYLLENIENLFHFGILILDDGTSITLNNPLNSKFFRDWQVLKSKFMGKLEQFLETLPGYAGAKPTKPWPVRALTLKDITNAQIKYQQMVGNIAETLVDAEKELELATAAEEKEILTAEEKEIREKEKKILEQKLIEARRDVDNAFFSILGKKILQNEAEAEANKTRLADLDELVSNAQKKTAEFSSDQSKPMQSRDKVNEQFGYITMQLVRATNDLTFNYGHIYNVDIGEIDFRDIALNRRMLYISLPALTRSKSSMEQLGKMSVSAVKSLMGEMLNVPFEGKIRTTIDARPSNASIPFSVILDEYGYYVVEGFAVAPAQARSYGFSITVSVQEYNSLLKANPAEGEAIFENTNLRIAGKITGGEESDTFKRLSGAAGSGYYFKDGELEYEKGRIGGSFKRGQHISIDKTSRINYNDLAGQRDGEFTLIVGTKTGDTKSGNVNVVRYTAYYTGNMPPIEEMRLNHYVMVKPLPISQRDALLKKIDDDRLRKEALNKWLSINENLLFQKIQERLVNIDKTFEEYLDKKIDEKYFKPTYELDRLKAHSNYYLSGINSAENAKDTSDVERLSSAEHIRKTILNNRFMSSRAKIRQQTQNDVDSVLDWLKQNKYPEVHISQLNVFLNFLADQRVTREVNREKQIITSVSTNSATKIIQELLDHEVA